MRADNGKVKSELIRLGLIQLKLDNAIFSWFHHNNLEGLVACHVDDFIFGGSELFHSTVIDKLRNIFVVGSEEYRCFKFLGMQVHCTEHNTKLSMQSYVDSLSEINLSELPKERSQRLTEQQTKRLKQLSGQIHWV